MPGPDLRLVPFQPPKLEYGGLSDQISRLLTLSLIKSCRKAQAKASLSPHVMQKSRADARLFIKRYQETVRYARLRWPAFSARHKASRQHGHFQRRCARHQKAAPRRQIHSQHARSCGESRHHRKRSLLRCPASASQENLRRHVARESKPVDPFPRSHSSSAFDAFFPPIRSPIAAETWR